MAAANTGMTVHQMPAASLAKADPTRAFEPRDIDEGYNMAKLLVQSGLLPRGIQRPEAAFAIIAAGRELGLTAMQSLRSIHIIDGKPTLSADLVAALCKSRSDVCKYFRLVESTDKVARYETLRVGEPSPTVMSFTWEDATRAKLNGKDNWMKYPAAMLRARCITALARAVYPDLAMGVYDPDEVGEAVDAGPAQVYRPSSPEQIAAEVRAEINNGPEFSRLCDRVDAAETSGALNSIANDAVKLVKAGKITREDLEAVRVAVLEKRKLLVEAKASAKNDIPSKAQMVDSNEYNEAEAEAQAAQYDQ